MRTCSQCEGMGTIPDSEKGEIICPLCDGFTYLERKEEENWLFEGEEEAINKVLEAGAEFGYGNMIAYLKKAWAESLIRNGASEKTALMAADVKAHHVSAHRIKEGW